MDALLRLGGCPYADRRYDTRGAVGTFWPFPLAICCRPWYNRSRKWENRLCRYFRSIGYYFSTSFPNRQFFFRKNSEFFIKARTENLRTFPVRVFPFAQPREPLIKSQERLARDFVSKLRFGNRRNTLCISRFSNRQVGAKDPLSAAAYLFRGSLAVCSLLCKLPALRAHSRFSAPIGCRRRWRCRNRPAG